MARKNGQEALSELASVRLKEFWAINVPCRVQYKSEYDQYSMILIGKKAIESYAIAVYDVHAALHDIRSGNINSDRLRAVLSDVDRLAKIWHIAEYGFPAMPTGYELRLTLDACFKRIGSFVPAMLKCNGWIGLRALATLASSLRSVYDDDAVIRYSLLEYK